MNGFDKNLIDRARFVDGLLSPLGVAAPKKRLLVVDYKRDGMWMNVSLVAYQTQGVTDEMLVAELQKNFGAQGDIIYSIAEVNEVDKLIGALYYKIKTQPKGQV